MRYEKTHLPDPDLPAGSLQPIGVAGRSQPRPLPVASARNDPAGRETGRPLHGGQHAEGPGKCLWQQGRTRGHQRHRPLRALPSPGQRAVYGPAGKRPVPAGPSYGLQYQAGRRLLPGPGGGRRGHHLAVCRGAQRLHLPGGHPLRNAGRGVHLRARRHHPGR